MQQILTWLIIGVVVVFVAVFDFIRWRQGLAAGDGSAWTISGVLHSLDESWPFFGYLLAFAFGFITCHFFGATTTAVAKFVYKIIGK